MRIELTKLVDGRAEFAHLYQPEELDLLDERVRLSGPASIEGTARNTGSQTVVTGHVEAHGQVECDRCLQPVEFSVDTDFSIDYVPGGDYEAVGAVELTEDEMSLSVFDGEGIDIGEIVREQLLFAAPMRALCREDCKGICLNCGTDRNVNDCGCETSEGDPRWAALRNLTSGKS